MIEAINIMPISYFTQFYNSPERDSSIMAMTHLVLQNEEYTAFVNELQRIGTRIILDNSAPYLGKSIDDHLLEKCISLVNPDLVVLPDVINDFEETMKRTTNFSQNVGLPQMAVPQGNTLREYEVCYAKFVALEPVEYIGISYTVRNIFQDSNELTAREHLIKHLVFKGLIDTTKKHHLLGMSNSGNLEINRLSKYNFITASDSNTAFKLAAAGISINEQEIYNKPKLKFDFDSEFDRETYDLMQSNISVLRTCGGSKC
jgi:hypothetical protein